MYRTQILSALTSLPAHTVALILTLIFSNLAFTILANASFKVSAQSANWRNFLGWQVIGNLAGLVTVITLTWLLRYQPLSVAFPLTTGLGVIGVQIIASHWLFKEAISLERWFGALLIVVGIVFLSK
jgi:multidrug transporter EmrE-like cation transporter